MSRVPNKVVLTTFIVDYFQVTNFFSYEEFITESKFCSKEILFSMMKSNRLKINIFNTFGGKDIGEKIVGQLAEKILNEIKFF